MMNLTETTETLLQLLVDCNAVYAGGNPNEQGLCDAIDNDGCHYQSAALAGWLEVARNAGIKPMLRLEKVPSDGEIYAEVSRRSDPAAYDETVRQLNQAVAEHVLSIKTPNV